jgi:hypothetical protein
MEPHGRIRTLVFMAIPLAAAFLLCDVAIRYWYREPLWRLAWDLAILHSSEERYQLDKPLARADPVVGYVSVPGVHNIVLVRGLARLSFRATIGSDGYRITGRDPERAGAPELWIFGCSFTWGLGLNDEQTFPWLVQSAMPAVRVRNLGQNGFGNVQALLQLRHAAERGERLPRLAVVVYNDFDRERNVGAPDYLRMMNGSGSSFHRAGVAVPVASLEGAGDLHERWEPLFVGAPIDPRVPAPAYQVQVTDAVMDGILDICSRHGIVPILAVQSGLDGDPVVEHARRKGYVIADLWVALSERGGKRYRLLPVDGHPNGAANRVWADKLLTVIRALRW